MDALLGSSGSGISDQKLQHQEGQQKQNEIVQKLQSKVITSFFFTFSLVLSTDDYFSYQIILV